jgi:hypothetical protein
VLKGHTGSVTSVAVSADGARIVTGSADNTARVWELFPGGQALIDQAKAIAPRCLTPVLRQRFHLPDAPPHWCIEMKKWPYHTAQWKQWLADKRAGKNPPLPDAQN